MTSLDMVSLGVLVKDGDIRFSHDGEFWHWSIVQFDDDGIERLIVESKDKWIELGFLRLVKLYETYRLENRHAAKLSRRRKIS